MADKIPVNEAIAKMAHCTKALEQIARVLGMSRRCTPQDVVDEVNKRLHG